MLFMSQAPRPAELMRISDVKVVCSPLALSLVVISHPEEPLLPKGAMATTGDCRATSPPRSSKSPSRNCM